MQQFFFIASRKFFNFRYCVSQLYCSHCNRKHLTLRTLFAEKFHGIFPCDINYVELYQPMQAISMPPKRGKKLKPCLLPFRFLTDFFIEYSLFSLSLSGHPLIAVFHLSKLATQSVILYIEHLCCFAIFSCFECETDNSCFTEVITFSCLAVLSPV